MKNRFRFSIALTVGSLLLAGCGSTPPRAEDETIPTHAELNEDFDPNAHFSYAQAYAPSSFDPFGSAAGLDQTYLAPIYDRLIYRSPDGAYEPMLADHWEPADDGLSLTLTLREGLTFTDGAPFDAEAVKTNLDRYLEPTSKLRTELSQVTGIEAVDDLTVRINVSDAVGALPATLAARAGMMVSPLAIATGDVASNPVGIGPYTATAVQPGEGVSLTRTENYWDPEVQRVATMELSGIAESQTRFNALISGQLTAAEISPEQINSAQADGMNVLSGPTPLLYFFVVNTAVEPFGDPDVRKAISMAIDREGIGQGLFEGYCTPQVQLWPANSDVYDEDFGDGLDAFPYDPDAAKKLLEEADVDSAKAFDAAVTNSSISVKLAEVIQSNLGEIGMTVNVNPVPSGGITENFAISKSMPTAVSGYTGPPDPAAFIERELSPTAIYNPSGEEYAAMSKAAAAGANTIDPAERKEAYADYMAEFVKAVPHIIPICMVSRVIAIEGSGSNLYASGDYVDLRGVAVSNK